jgi:hypothetical protein
MEQRELCPTTREEERKCIGGAAVEVCGGYDQRYGGGPAEQPSMCRGRALENIL